MAEAHDPLEHLIRENAEINAMLKAQAESNLSELHRPIERLGGLLSRPAFILTVLALFIAWVVLNLDLKFVTSKPWDEPPFFWLQGLIGLLSLLATCTVIILQSRQATLQEQRAQLQLQLVLMTEQRTAKIIGLLEELRLDLPNVHNRIDPEAEALKQSSKPEIILEALITLEDGPLATGAPAEREDERHE